MISISSTCFGRNYRPKHVELIEIIDKLCFHLVGSLYYYIVFLLANYKHVLQTLYVMPSLTSET